ncbi:hypothetical protein [Marinicauda algicola]|nr:hypothetical protein [Marinicauda algicola]
MRRQDDPSSGVVGTRADPEPDGRLDKRAFGLQIVLFALPCLAPRVLEP